MWFDRIRARQAANGQPARPQPVFYSSHPQVTLPIPQSSNLKTPHLLRAGNHLPPAGPTPPLDLPQNPSKTPILPPKSPISPPTPTHTHPHIPKPGPAPQRGFFTPPKNPPQIRFWVNFPKSSDTRLTSHPGPLAPVPGYPRQLRASLRL